MVTHRMAGSITRRRPGWFRRPVLVFIVLVGLPEEVIDRPRERVEMAQRVRPRQSPTTLCAPHTSSRLTHRPCIFCQSGPLASGWSSRLTGCVADCLAAIWRRFRREALTPHVPEVGAAKRRRPAPVMQDCPAGQSASVVQLLMLPGGIGGQGGGEAKGGGGKGGGKGSGGKGKGGEGSGGDGGGLGGDGKVPW